MIISKTKPSDAVLPIAGLIEGLDAGERSALRSMGATPPPCYWALLARSGAGDSPAMRVIVQCLALLRGTSVSGRLRHNPGVRLGKLMCTGGASAWHRAMPRRPAIAERRVAAFCQYRREARIRRLPSLVRQVSATCDLSGGFNLPDIAWTLVVEDVTSAIAAPYFLTLNTPTVSEKDSK